MKVLLENELLHIPPRTGPAWWVGRETYTFKLTGEDTDGTMTVFELLLHPGAGMPPHTHLNEDESCFVLDGEIEFWEQDECYTAMAGAYLYIPRGTHHTIRNTSTEPARLLVTAVPAGLEAFFLEVGQPARAGQVPRPMGDEQLERLKAVAPKYGLIIED